MIGCTRSAEVRRCVMLGVIMVLTLTCVSAQEGGEPLESPVVNLSEPGEAQQDPANSASTDELATDEKKRKASIALLAVGGIAILGVGIIAMTMIWARRLRRLARDAGPPQRTVGNDFWFLKPPKPSASSPDLSDTHLPSHDRGEDEDP